MLWSTDTSSSTYVPPRVNTTLTPFTPEQLARAPLPPILSPEMLNMRYACELNTKVEDADMAGASEQLKTSAVEV